MMLLGGKGCHDELLFLWSEAGDGRCGGQAWNLPSVSQGSAVLPQLWLTRPWRAQPVQRTAKWGNTGTWSE